MNFVINTILTGTSGITIALLIVQLFRLDLKIRPAIIISVGVLLLLGASMYLLKISIGIRDYFSAIDEDSFKVKSGRQWVLWIFFYAWPFNFGVLPQLLWVKRLRGRLSVLVVIVAVWALTILFVPWDLPQFFIDVSRNLLSVDWRISAGFSFFDYLEQAAVYAVAYAITFYLVSRREAGEEPIAEEPGKVD